MPRDFNNAAASWDENPTRVRLAKAIADAIINLVTITPETIALDIGCGTGLLTLRFQPLVRSIIGIDSSHGMLEVLNSKIRTLNLANIETLYADLEADSELPGKFDLIVSGMTLHHIKDVPALLARCSEGIVPGGYLCLADLDLDGGNFHDDNTGVYHFGFDREVLRRLFAQAGFADITESTVTEIEKPTADGTIQRFSIFLMAAKKR